MKEFFKVKELSQVIGYSSEFPLAGTEEIPLVESLGRILSTDIVSDMDIPDFSRSTMDGYAVCASSTFGATEGNPAYFNLNGTVAMGEIPAFSIGAGVAAKISTGGMLPDGADAVVMVEHTEALDDTTIEVYRSVAPGQHMVEIGEDIKKGDSILSCGQKIRPQESGLLAAMGKQTVTVYKKPVVGIISTGDEIVPIQEIPGPGQIRDINSYTLSGLVQQAGGVPLTYGIVRDNLNVLTRKCALALSQSDMVMISGGSSVGTRDFTISVLSSLPDASILVHGISISPGKPTILAKVGNKAFWGLPGHVVSAMVIFNVVVRPFIDHISGISRKQTRVWKLPAILSRNISSAQGRTDYIRVRLVQRDNQLTAEPILGKSGLIRTMVKADGLIEVGMNIEGLDKDTPVEVILL